MPSELDIAERLYQERPHATALAPPLRNNEDLTPEILRSATSIHFSFPAWDVRLILSRIREGKGNGPQAEVSVMKATAELSTARLLLLSPSSRGNLAKALREQFAAPPWGKLLERICAEAVRLHRTSEPAIYLEGKSIQAGESFVLNPLMYARHPTLLYGPGDSGKSFLALYCAMLLSIGDSQNGLACSDWPTLYLDWELAREDMDQRMALLKAGHSEFKSVRLGYRRLCSPLPDCLEDVTRTIQETGARVVVIDSVALAAGAELEKAETAIRFFEALRSLNMPSLLIGHTAKNTDEKSPFGSVFFYNLARNVWEVAKIQEHDSGRSRIGLYHRKCNLGPRRSPLGFELTIQQGTATVTTCDLAEEPDLARGLPIADQIEHLLKDGQARTAKEIAEDLNARHETVKVTLSRWKGKRWLHVGTGKEGKWTLR